MSPILDSLTRVSLFSGLDPADLEVLNAHCRWRRANAGNWLLDYGEGGTDVFFVLHGHLRVMILSADQEVILRDLFDGDFFGELSAIDGSPRSAGIVAVTDAMIGSMTARKFLDAVHRHPSICHAVLQRLAAEIRKLANQVNEFSTLSVRQRLRAELLRLARHKATNGEWLISPPPTHAVLAARISTHREAVTRELKVLERSRFIERRRGAIVLLDPERLRRTIGDV